MQTPTSSWELHSPTLGCRFSRLVSVAIVLQGHCWHIVEWFGQTDQHHRTGPSLFLQLCRMTNHLLIVPTCCPFKCLLAILGQIEFIHLSFLHPCRHMSYLPCLWLCLNPALRSLHANRFDCRFGSWWLCHWRQGWAGCRAKKRDCGGGVLCFASDCLLIGATDCHLLRRVQTLGKTEFACLLCLRDWCTLAAQFEGGGLCDVLIHMPTPSWHVDEDLMSFWRKGLCVDWCAIVDLTCLRWDFFLDSSCGVGATLKLDRKTMAEHRGVIYQTNQKRAPTT